MAFVKGQSGNPKGRPPNVVTGLTKTINQNKQALKLLVLSYLNLTEEQIRERQRRDDIPMIEKMLGQVIERIANDGDMVKLRMLLEIPLGKLPEEKDPLDLDSEETLMILTYRKKKEEHERRSVTDSSDDPGRDLESEPGEESEPSPVIS